MSQLRDAIKRGVGPQEVKRVLNIRGADSGLDVSSFGGLLSSADDTVQKALDTLDDAAVVLKSLFDANTIIAANTDNTPAAVTVAEQRLVGRITGGNITALTVAQVLTLLGLSDPPIGALIAIIEDQKTSGTNGGTFTSGSDQTRDLNTLVYNRDTTVSLNNAGAGPGFTLPAGDWDIEWSAPAFEVFNHQTLLYNTSDSSEVKRGSTEYTADADNTQTRSFGSAHVSIAGSKTFEVRHRCNTTKATFGLGGAASFGTEVYTKVVVRAG